MIMLLLWLCAHAHGAIREDFPLVAVPGEPVRRNRVRLSLHPAPWLVQRLADAGPDFEKLQPNSRPYAKHLQNSYHTE